MLGDRYLSSLPSIQNSNGITVVLDARYVAGKTIRTVLRAVEVSPPFTLSSDISNGSIPASSVQESERMLHSPSR